VKLLLQFIAFVCLGPQGQRVPPANMFGKRKSYFAGKHAFITGGSEGIGFALAEELIREGAKVTILARTQSKLDAAAAKLRDVKNGPESAQLGDKVFAISGDVTEFQQVGEC